MAGEWIKWTKGLTSRPEILGIARILKVSKREAAAMCMEAWEWADTNTKDGNAVSVTGDDLDVTLSAHGLSKAMAEVGWLILKKDGLTFPNFDRHNSQSAKTRALTSDRVSKYRKRKCNGQSVTRALPEKRREDKNKHSPLPPFPKELDTPAFRQAWSDWVAYRKQRRFSPYVSLGLRKLFTKLAKMGPERAIAAIELSIESNWTGIHEGTQRPSVSGHPRIESEEDWKKRGPAT